MSVAAGYNAMMNATANHDIHTMMEQASQSLAKRDYLACEQLSLASLQLAKKQQDWASYARILLPLQEARRQRRIIALEGVLRLGTQSLDASELKKKLTQMQAGCVVITLPYTAEQAHAALVQVREAQCFVELLYAAVGEGGWVVQPCEHDAREQVRCAPPAVCDRWLKPGDAAAASWFLKVCERIGDVALEQIQKTSLTDAQRLEQLEQAIHRVGDHELLHQALGRVAQAMARQQIQAAAAASG